MNAREDGWEGRQAQIEGWFITVDGKEIRAFSWSEFYRDGHFKALAFVTRRAQEGSAYHVDALARTQLL